MYYNCDCGLSCGCEKCNPELYQGYEYLEEEFYYARR